MKLRVTEFLVGLATTVILTLLLLLAIYVAGWIALQALGNQVCENIFTPQPYCHEPRFKDYVLFGVLVTFMGVALGFSVPWLLHLFTDIGEDVLEVLREKWKEIALKLEQKQKKKKVRNK